MATAESVHQDLLDKIEELAKKTTRPDGALMLAEAYALMYQNHPHGGSPSTG